MDFNLNDNMNRNMSNSSSLSDGSIEQDNDAIFPLPSNRKRKSFNQLSSNPHTVKARKRNEKLNQDPIASRIEKAKQADQGAITYAKKKLVTTPAYLAASPEQQQQMITRSAVEVTVKRERLGKDWKSLAAKLGVGQIGGQFAIEDDGNPAWEDIEYESDNEYEFEQMWKFDEKMNNEGTPIHAKKEELEEASQIAQQRSIANHKKLEFKTFRRRWRGACKSLFRKLRKLERGGIEWLTRTNYPYISRQGFHYWKGPEKYFTTAEKAIWKNLATWAFEEEEWIDLPGPADWWPADELIDATGFAFSDHKNAQGHRQAIEMLQSKIEPEDGSYDYIFPSHTDFLVMDDDSIARMGLKAFYSIGRTKIRRN